MPGNSNDNPQSQQMNIDLRQALSDAYSAVEDSKLTQSFASYSFEDALSAQITQLSGPGTDSRPNPIQAVQNIANSVMQAAQQLMALPADQFVPADISRDVNTPA